MQLKALTQKDISQYKRALLNLYDTECKRPREYWKSLKNSHFIIVALERNKIFGASRIVTDLSMFAMIFDVFVDADHRNRGIGSRIMKKTVQFCQKKKIKNVSLVTDPSYLWLPNFYKEFGFAIDNSRGEHMFLER